MYFEPLGDRVIVEVKKVDERKSAAGIVITQTAEAFDRKPTQGKVIAIGPGRVMESPIPEGGRPVRCPMDVKVGDEILFQRYAPEELRLDGVAENAEIGHYCVSQGDIMVVIKQ